MIIIQTFLFLIMIFFSISCHAKVDLVQICESFPSSYSDLVFFQKKGLLNKNSVDNIFNNKCIHKVVASGINGEWDADDINYFQKKTIIFFNKNPMKICNVLKKYNDNDIKSYFRFLLDSERINYLNEKKVAQCGNNILKSYAEAKKEYLEMRSTSDKNDISIRRYLGDEFLDKGEKILVQKKILFENDLYESKIILTVLNDKLKLYILKNFGDNTFYDFQSSDSFFLPNDISEKNMLKVTGIGSFELYLKNINNYKVIKFEYDKKEKLFKVVSNVNVYINSITHNKKITNCPISGDEFHDYNMRVNC